MSESDNTQKTTGYIAWMVTHPVTANLCMLVLLIGGIFAAYNIKQEIFPEFDLDTVTITVSYPGATPLEVENGIIKVIEENIEDIENIDEINSEALEGSARITVELSIGSDNNKVYQDIKNTVDRISSFPEKAESPLVSLTEMQREVLDIVIYGNQSPEVLKETAEKMRDILLNTTDITNIEMKGIRDPEISVEIPSATLRQYGLTNSAIATLIKNNSLEMGGGTIKTSAGEILLKLDHKRDYGNDFYDIPLIATTDGDQIKLGDVAVIRDDFEDSDKSDYFNGLPAVMLKIYRTGDQTPKAVSQAAEKFLSEINYNFDDKIQFMIWNNHADVLNERIELLGKNIWMGLILVMLLLGCFLQVRLAFWVMMGIPISFLGSFIFLPYFDISINMISLFAFITALGMVVDDAIVVGENIFELRQKGVGFVEASIRGTRQVAVPVVFSIITNVVAFAPLLFVPGTMGKIFKVMPIVVISVFLISLFEALFILPSHLAHQLKSKPGDIWSKLNRMETWFGNKLKLFINKYYRPILLSAIRYRYITSMIFLSIMIIFIAYVKGGHLSIIFFPQASSDVTQATVNLPYGSAVEKTKIVHDILVKAALDVAKEYAEQTGKEILKGIYSGIGSAGRVRGGGNALSGGHTTNVEVFLVPTDQREISTTEFKNRWRNKTGNIPGVEKMIFLDDPHGPTGGDPISFSLAHSDVGILQEAANKLAAKLAEYDGVNDIENGFAQGKVEFDFTLTDAAKKMGFTANDIASQIRSLFYGVEALRQQRDRDEIKVMVRLPENERNSVFDLEELILLSPDGKELPFNDAVLSYQTRADTSIKRIDGQRSIKVAADIDDKSQAGFVINDILQGGFMDKLKEEYPGLTNKLAGNRQDLNDSLNSLSYGLLLAVLIIYATLAIPFNSYLQPVIIMISIPFGIIGAALGHIIMGYSSLSLPSFMGIVALSGVVVNDSLVLVDHANNLKNKGLSIPDSVFRSGIRRFRPIMLTSLTTFGGLAPMIFETSRQATFMIPMALSLGYGILFATFIALILVPALYVIVDDIKKLNKKFWQWKIL